MRHQSNAMQTANESVLDLYLEIVCLGTIQTQDLDFLATYNSGSSSDFKLIQHIRSKIATGEIRVAKKIESKINNSNANFFRKKKTFSAKVSIQK